MGPGLDKAYFAKNHSNLKLSETQNVISLVHKHLVSTTSTKGQNFANRRGSNSNIDQYIKSNDK